MRVLDELASFGDLPFERATMLPFEAYTSAEVLELEVAEIFERGWTCVARDADLGVPGDHAVVDLPASAGRLRSVLVVRGDDQLLRAFDNVCVHRGAQLVEDCGNSRRLTCPYHAWSYRLDGQLIGGPRMVGSVESDGVAFDPSRHRLGQLQVEVWNGFVFVNPDRNATPLEPRLSGLSDVVDRYDMARYVTVHRSSDTWQTNWKLLAENFLDAYHVAHVHRATFGADGDSTDETFVMPGTLDHTHHRVVEAGGPDLAGVRTDLDGDWRRSIVLAAVFPSFVVQLQPDWLWSLALTPIGTDQVRIDAHVAVPAEVLAAAVDECAYVERLVAFLDRVNAEDRRIVEGVRRSADGPQFERAPLAPLERNVYDFDRYVATTLSSRRST